MPNGLDQIAIPEDESIQFVEDGRQDTPIAALIAIRDEVGEEALTDEEYALLAECERQCIPASDANDHHANLAEYLDERDLNKIGLDVLNWVEWDEESRAEWQAVEQRGIRALGVSPNVDGGANFEGASTVVHPLLGEACVQFSSRAMDVMWPAEGPVKSKILGAIDENRQEQSKRVEQFMNYQYTELMPGAFEQTDKLLIRLPLSGSCFIKGYYDPINGVMRSLVEPADFIVPYRATDLLTTPRYTERLLMSQNDVRRRQVAGLYRDVDMVEPIEDTNETEREVVVDEIRATEGRSDNTHTMDDQRRTLYECYCELDLPGFEDKQKGKATGIALPYVVTVDKDSRKVLSIYRNWKPNDPHKKRIIYHIHYRFMPGLGFYGYGLYHWIGGLSAAATGALRALLDSASFANQQGGYKVGEVAIKDADKAIAPGEFREISTDMDDIRKALIPFNWKEPSQTLFALLGHLEQMGQRFANTTDAMVGGGTENTPVGTILARIEQGTKVFTTIQLRLHQAAGQEYKLVAWLDSIYLPDEYPYAVEGEDRGVMRADFDDRIDVVPVSDPNVASSIQRYFISQAVMQLAQSAPGMYDMRKLHKRALASLRVDDADELMPDKKGRRRDPVSEGAAAMIGLPLRAYLDEHHPAHIAVHQSQMAMLPQGSPQAAAMMAHVQEHAAMKYLVEMQAATGIRFNMPTDEEEESEELPPEVEAQIAIMAAEAVQQMTPPPQPDPAMIAAMADQSRKDSVTQAEQARKDAVTQADIERKDTVALADVTRQDRTETEALAERIAQQEAVLLGSEQL